MDVINHGLWGSLLMYPKYRKEKWKVISAFIFGVLPDVLVFTPMFLYVLVHGGERFSPALFANLSDRPWVFKWAMEGYNYTHSFVIAAIVILGALAIRKGKMFWPLIAWPLHLTMDMFTHPNFFHTPIFYPISSYQYAGGVSWGTPWLLLLNYGLLISLYTYVRWQGKREDVKL